VEKGSTWSARTSRRRATAWQVCFEASRPGYLVLTDAYYPGWRAESDGEPVAIYRADVMFRAVPIHEGQQTIVFTFKPFAIPFGWQIAAVGAVTLLLAAVSVSSVLRQPDNRIRIEDV
jgi:uncharacterized membrane protein YfhO